MLHLVPNLNIRFDTVLQSKDDRIFYLNLYHYFDHVVKTPELNAILEQSERDYRAKHVDLWKSRPKSEEEADEASDQTMKLERFHLFCVGAFILGRIYEPIEDYKTTSESDRDQDPVAVILLRGVDYALSLKKWNIKNLGVYNRWFEGKRDSYESDLRRFHIMLLDELEKPKTQTTLKPLIGFDKEKSILKFGDKEVLITLKNDKTNSHYVLEYIFENGKENPADYVDIIKVKFPNERVSNMSIYRACRDINEKVSKQAEISNFLVIKSGKTGYTQINPIHL
jgi:hypothetical protein